MGLQTVGRIFVVPDDKPAFKSDEIHFGRWVWESDLPTGPADPGCSLDANESYEDRLVCVYSLLAAQARGACSLDGPPD